MIKDPVYRLNKLYIVVCLSACLVISCTRAEINIKNENGDTTISGTFTGFSSNAELVAYLKNQYSKSVYTNYPYALETAASGVNSGGSPVEGTIGAESPMDSSFKSSESYSSTNLQETGVDESDAVKTDGEYLYIARNDTVTLVKAADPMAVINTIKVSGTVDSMYLYNNMLVLLYTPTDYQGAPWIDSSRTDIATIGIPYWIPVQAKTGVAFYDISDRTALKELKTVESDGYLVSSRRIENHLHIVQQFLPSLPGPEVLEEQIQGMTIENLMPFYSEVTGSAGAAQEVQLVAAQDFYHPDADGGGSMVTIMTFDLDNPDLTFTSTGVVADASIVYASTRALYCTSTYWNGLQAESEQPVEQTIIYKFDLAGGQATGQGYISVNGRALNQFSLGEYDGVLRIATTTGYSWDASSASENHVFCVKSQNGQLGIIGSLNNIAPGEELYSARFVGMRGFLVTYVRTDPLFTLDLSDPSNPKIAGELVIPGYSSYIQPYGDNFLIAVGKETVEQDGFAWYQGVQLSIFDISDFSSPQLLHKTIIGDRGTDSEALYNHKAFNFWESNGLLALPVNLYEYQTTPASPSDYGDFTFCGLYVYRVSTDKGFQQIGRIPVVSDINQYWYSSGWTRGIFIDDKVYAITPEDVHSADVADIEGTIHPLSIAGASD
jgi:inhibitor of cysteine peptidase